MKEKIENLIKELNSGIENIRRHLEAMNDNDSVGINTAHSLIAEKEDTIEKLKKII